MKYLSNPFPIPCSSAYRCLPAVIAPLLLICATASGQPTPWAQRSIATLDGSTPTNAPVAEEPAEPLPPADPSRARLQQLIEGDLEPAAATGTTANATSPYQRRITELGGYREIDTDTLDERLALSQLEADMQAVDQLIDERRGDLASSRLQQLLEQAQFDSVRMRLHQKLGVLAFRQLDYATAAQQIEAALALDPNNAALASNLAAAQMSLGDLDAARNTLESIQLGLIRSRRLLFSIHFNLACIYSLSESDEPALNNLYRAAEQDPASTLASLGDPQLDFIRTEERFASLRDTLESLLRQNR
jgi:tetratricopeptide (TPR) repeat protein